MRRLLTVALVVFAAGSPVGAAPPKWQRAAPLPAPRSEIGAAVVGGEIFVVGGFTPGGQGSARVDAFSRGANRWRQAPDLPLTAHHPAVAGYRGRLYVAGGYGAGGQPLAAAHVLANGRWASLPSMPERRAAAGAGFVDGKLYVVGGVARTDGRRLATKTLRYDPARRRWTAVPGPIPREHLGVAALKGRLYAVGGRTVGLDTNLATFEAYRPGTRTWQRLPSVPGKRGGTGAAASGRLIISAGGEEPAGTIRTVFGYDIVTRRWRRLPDLPTARHGLGVATAGARVYVVAGGTQPGLAGVSGANEFLTLR